MGVCDTDGVFSPAGIPAGVTGNCKPTESGNSIEMQLVTIKWGATEGGNFQYSSKRHGPVSIRSVVFTWKSAGAVLESADFAELRLFRGMSVMVKRRGKPVLSEQCPEAAPATDAALQPRAERLAAIRRAVEAGEYDSEELLAKAFDRMLQRYQSGLAAD